MMTFTYRETDVPDETVRAGILGPLAEYNAAQTRPYVTDLLRVGNEPGHHMWAADVSLSIADVTT
jgi:hypothetical protein